MTITLHPVDAVDTDSDGVPDFPTYTGQHLRQVLSAIIGGSTASRPLGSFTGVSPGTPSNTVTASGTTWTIQPHAGVMDVETPVASGPYFYAIDSAVTGAVTAANATNPRIDLLSLQLSDPAMADGSTAPGLAATYTAGVASATPSAPGAPARCLVLAQIYVPASGGPSPTVTWVAPYLSAAGGIQPCAAAANYPASPYEGQYVDNALADGAYRWDGAAWRPAYGGGARSKCTRTNAQVVPTSTDTTVLGWAADADGHIGLTYSAGVWTVQTPGVYQIQGLITYPSIASPTGQRVGRIKVNGAIVHEFSARPDASFNCPLSLMWGGRMSVGDTISVSTYQSQGANATLGTADEGNHIHIVRL